MNISLFQAASALNANARWQEVISQNMAASSVPGYKAQQVSFQAVEAGLLPASAASAADRNVLTKGVTGTNFSQGEMRSTGVPTDLAIQGKGFFEVQLPNGALAYTRDGEFQINGSGQLTTKNGYLVMSDAGPIQLDRASGESITVMSDGTVSQGEATRGTLKIVEFNKTELMTPIPGGMFVAQNQGLEVVAGSKPDVRQGVLEQSNTSTVTEMANLITVMRASEANQRIIQMQDERMGRAISELGNPS